jgi:hypothetical protein
MSEPCMVCRDPRKGEIDAALCALLGPKPVAERYNLPRGEVMHHRFVCLYHVFGRRRGGDKNIAA